MNEVGRNDPCPCGSGRKYKRCCMGESHQLAVAASLHDLDHRVVATIFGWAVHEAVPSLRAALGALGFEDPEDLEDWAVPLLPTVVPALGPRTLAEEFREERPGRLAPDEEGWLDALSRSWISLWEIVEIEPGRSIALHDLLTGARRRIVERQLTESATPRTVLCGRVVEIRGLHVLAGAHEASLRSSQAEEVAASFCEEIGLERPLTPENLRGNDAVGLLLAWDDAVKAARSRPLPTLQNVDGDPLQATVDVFTIAPGCADEVAQGLANLDGVEEDRSPAEQETPGRTNRRFRLVREDDTVLAAFHVRDDRLRIDTTSEARADAARARVEGALGTLLTFEDRERKDAQDFLASQMGREPRPAPPPGPDAPEGPEIDAIVRNFKEKHYATWPDEALPMLDGLTPREAVGDPALRRRIVATLKDFEQSEARETPGRRFDVNVLRRALGIGPDE